MIDSSRLMTAIRLHPDDDVVCLLRQHEKGETPVTDPPSEVVLAGSVPLGHKVAIRELAAGDIVRKYGQAIGRATKPIAAGEHVHLHNLRGLLAGEE